MNKLKKMHILILPSWYPNSFNPQSGIFFQEQAEALARNKHMVSVLSIHEIHRKMIFSRKQKIYSNKIFYKNNIYTHIIEYPAIPRLYKLRDKIKNKVFRKMFKKYIKIQGLPDIIHVHSFMVGDFAIWIKKNYNIPYIVTEHFSGFALNTISNNNLIKASHVFKNSNCNIAVSSSFQKFFKNKFNQYFILIPNIVNINFFKPINQLRKKEFNFINIGFLNENKNQSMLIKAFTSSFIGQLDIKLTIVGDGSEYVRLRTLIKQLNMQKQIQLYGRANREQVRNLLQNSDAFVLSSKYETFGIVVIEALSCGLPVVVTKCGGVEDIVVSSKLGLISDINQKCLSENLINLLKNKSNYNKNYISEYVKNNFSEEVVIKRVEKIYRKVIEKS